MAKAAVKAKRLETVSEVQAELDRLEAERSAAVAEHLRLADLRESVLLDGTDEALLQHDEAMASAKVQAERAALKHERLLPQLDEAEAAEDQARRRKVYAEAKVRLADGAAAYDAYEPAAQELARIAKRICAASLAITEANKALPEGCEPLRQPEPYNGAPPQEAEYREQTRIVVRERSTGQEVMVYSPDDPDIERVEVGTGMRVQVAPAWPGRPHRSFLANLRIPGREPDTTLF